MTSRRRVDDELMKSRRQSTRVDDEPIAR